ncbi:MAG: glycosyltransferase [Flavobacteriaceae bacterium]|nr:glycosyltransferase [Flavobacteriaceae bacterium]
MRIGLVLSKTPSYSETFFISKIEGLLTYGHDVVLFVQKKDPSFSLCPVNLAPKVYKKNKLLQLFKSILVFLTLFISRPKRLQKFIKLEKQQQRSTLQILKNCYNNSHILKDNLDCLHFGFATMAIQSENVAAAMNSKMAVSLRGYDVDIYPLQNKGCYELLWEKVDKVHAISNYTLNKGIALGLSAKKLSSIITPAVDISDFKYKHTEPQEVPHFLTIGRLHWIKGHAYVLEALSKINNMGIAFDYSIIGSGRELGYLRYLIYQLGLEERVNLIGEVRHDNIKDYFKRSDFYIQYSLSEGFCNAVLEAQAMGLFCMVSDGGALPENVIDRKTGWVIPKRNVKALVNSITEVLNLPEAKKNEIKMAAIKRVSDHFNMEDYHKKFDSFYS